MLIVIGTHLRLVEVWYGQDGNVWPKIVILANVRALVVLVHIVQEGGLACN